MANRRNFLKAGLASVAGLAIAPFSTLEAFAKQKAKKQVPKEGPIVLSTWRFGIKANEEAWKVLSQNGYALDAVEQGVRIIESDPEERSVGYGGRPDRDGHVTLDACIMDDKANIGAVLCLEHIKNPISVARAVMEKTPHVILAGEGALQFALSQGFKKENLLVPESEKEWKEWLKNSQYKPIINIENHDTIGMLALDAQGRLSGACTTSGMAFKMRGRIGDSPIIGAGLYVDQEAGAAVATGHGEEVIRVVGSHLVVMLMSQGLGPSEACKEAVKQIEKKFRLRGKDMKETQIGFLALAPDGRYGAFALQKGFNFAIKSKKESGRLLDVAALL